MYLYVGLLVLGRWTHTCAFSVSIKQIQRGKKKKRPVFYRPHQKAFNIIVKPGKKVIYER